MKTDKELREKLAELEHQQWEEWARSLIKSGEKLSPERLDRWANLFIPYSKLTEKQKDQDRKWADKILSLFHSYALGIIGYVAMGIDAKESEYKERYYRNQLRAEQRKKIREREKLND